MNIRRNGETTRLVDEAIQEFFTNGTVTLNDHHWPQKMEMAEFKRYEHIKKVFLRRLSIEHSWTNDKIEVVNNVVTLKK